MLSAVSKSAKPKVAEVAPVAETSEIITHSLTHSLTYLLTHSKPVATEAPKVEETKEVKAADVDKPAPVAAKPDVYVLCICSVVTVFYTIVALILKPNHRFIQFILITI